VELDGAPEDPVQKHEQVVFALVGELAAAPYALDPRAPAFDLLERSRRGCIEPKAGSR
jgi:hypothetical protein